MKFAKKHIEIVKCILEKGKYKPTYSDREPATITLEKNGIIEWNASFTGLILTDYGISIKDQILKDAQRE